MSFDFNAFAQALPHPRDAASHYGGMPEARPHPTMPRGWVQIPKEWWDANLVTVPIAELPNWPLYQGVERVRGVTVNRRVRELVVATWAEVNQRGLAHRVRSYDGAFAARHMSFDPSRPLSLHTWGIALDFDARWNGYRVPLEQAGINREFVRCMEECGWAWGGRWSPAFVDAMHFEAVQPAYAVNVDAQPQHKSWPPHYPSVGSSGLLLVYDRDNRLVQSLEVPEGGEVRSTVRFEEGRNRYHVRVMRKEQA